MPAPEEILRSLAILANRARWLAVGWHAVVVVGAFALIVGWRPRQRDAALLLVTPLFSVSALAVLYASPFDAVLFAALSIWLAGVAMRSVAAAPVVVGPWWARTAGVCLIVFGCVYPHSFAIVEPSVVTQLFTAPMGIIPCPTLSLVIGWTLTAGGFDSRSWTIGLGTAGLFYGLFGAFVLGVGADLVLVVGALTLLWSLAPVPWPRRVKVSPFRLARQMPRFE